jgi:glycosyltransferase involved in cell wall biosynthesis
MFTNFQGEAPKKKRVLICLPFFTLGGAETQAFYLANFLQSRKEVEVEVWAFSNPGQLSEKLNEVGITWKQYPLEMNVLHKKGIKKFITLWKLAIAIRKGNFDFLFPFTYYPNVFLSSVWRFTGVKKCFWNQRGLETLAINAIERWAILQKPFYLANSKTSANFISKRHNLNTEKIKVIYNGIPETDAKISEELSQPIKLLMLSNFFPEKDHITVLKAFNILLNRINIPIKLIFAGYSPQPGKIEKVKALAFDMNLHGHVLFLTSTSNSKELIQEADITLLSTLSEGCSNSIMEYMANAKPVITTDIPANRELLGEDYPYLFAPEDENKLAFHLQTIIESKEKRQQNGELNLRRVRMIYSIEKMQLAYLNLINE